MTKRINESWYNTKQDKSSWEYIIQKQKKWDENKINDVKKMEASRKIFSYKEIEVIEALIRSDLIFFKQLWLNDEKFWCRCEILRNNISLMTNRLTKQLSIIFVMTCSMNNVMSDKDF